MGKLLLLVVFVPLVELTVLIKVGGMIGAFDTVCIVVLAATVGFEIIRRAGWHVRSRVQADLARGRVPTDGLVEGLLVFVAGVLLIVPGLLTDLLGILLLIPPIRRLAARLLRRRFQGRMMVRFNGGFRAPTGDDFVDVEAHSPQDAPPRDRKLIDQPSDGRDD